MWTHQSMESLAVWVHLHVVGMLRFMFLPETKRACPLLFILFLCLFIWLIPLITVFPAEPQVNHHSYSQLSFLLATSAAQVYKSLSLQTHHLPAILPDLSCVFQIADDVQWSASRTQPYSGAELSAAYVQPGTAKCIHAVLRTRP